MVRIKYTTGSFREGFTRHWEVDLTRGAAPGGEGQGDGGEDEDHADKEEEDNEDQDEDEDDEDEDDEVDANKEEEEEAESEDEEAESKSEDHDKEEKSDESDGGAPAEAENEDPDLSDASTSSLSTALGSEALDELHQEVEDMSRRPANTDNTGSNPSRPSISAATRSRGPRTIEVPRVWPSRKRHYPSSTSSSASSDSSSFSTSATARSGPSTTREPERRQPITQRMVNQLFRQQRDRAAAVEAGFDVAAEEQRLADRRSGVRRLADELAATGPGNARLVRDAEHRYLDSMHQHLTWLWRAQNEPEGDSEVG